MHDGDGDKKGEIEVTPAMIEAGVDVFWTMLGDRFGSIWPFDRDFVRRVYVEMQRASGPHSSP